MTDATDSIKKYFNLFSFLSSIMIGIKLKELISILSHVKSYVTSTFRNIKLVSEELLDIKNLMNFTRCLSCLH